MPTAATNTAKEDPILARLREEWAKKDVEIRQIIDNPKSTGSMLLLAEKMEPERDSIGEQIESRLNELGKLDAIRSRTNDAQKWMGEPQRTLPHGGPGGRGAPGGAFKSSGWEAAGYQSWQAHQDPMNPQNTRLKMIHESGPGSFKEGQWELLNSFEYHKDFVAYLKSGSQFAAQRTIDLCQKTLQAGLDDQGGVFAPAELVDRIIGRLPAPTSLRGLVTTLTTGRDSLIMPRKQYQADDVYTTAFRVTWTGEIPSDGTGLLTRVNDTNLLGEVQIPVHTAMMSAPVTRNLIEDSAFPIQAWLESELAQTIDITYEDMILNGSTYANTTLGAPAAQPIGILYGAATGNPENNTSPEVLNSGTAGGFAYNDLIALQGALAPQYEDDEKTVWVMQKRSTYVYLEQIKDSQGRPLFTTGYEDSGMVRRRGRVLLGDKVILSQLMPVLNSSNFPIIYGDMRGYYLAQRIGFSIQVLDQTLARANQIEPRGTHPLRRSTHRALPPQDSQGKPHIRKESDSCFGIISLAIRLRGFCPRGSRRDWATSRLLRSSTSRTRWASTCSSCWARYRPEPPDK